MKKEVKMDLLVWLIIITFVINIFIFPPREAFAATGAVPGEITFGLRIEGMAESYFTECTGVGSENEVVEYKTIDAYGKEAIQKLPGRLAWNEIVLKRGLTGNKDMWAWRKQVEDGQIDNARMNISVVMYVNNRETAKWNLQNAWPCRISASLNTDGIMEEEIGLVYEKPVREVVVTSYTVGIGVLSGGLITASPTVAKEGDIVNLSVTPDPGKRLVSDSLKYNDGTDYTINNTSFIMPAADVTVTAEFEAIPPIVTDEDKVAADKTVLDIEYAAGDSAGSVTQNLSLQATGAVYGSTIDWCSNNAVVVSNSGIVTRPAFEYGDANVTVTASITSNGVVDTKDFNLTVLKLAQNSYTVTFDKNGGDSEASPTTKTAGSGESIGTLPTAPTRTGYTFIGWNTAANGSGTSFTAVMAVTSDITVYAQWMEVKTITASTGSGGSISPSGSVNVSTGGSQTFTITPDSGRRIKAVTVDGINKGAVTTYTFTNITANHAIYASFTSTSTTPVTTTYNADVSAGNGSDSTLPVTVDGNNNSAVIVIGSGNSFMSGRETTVITVPAVPDVDRYTLSVPALALSTHDTQGNLAFNTDVCRMTIPSDMLTGITGISGIKASITMGKGDKANLSDELMAAIGNRPLVQFNLSIDGRQTEWNNPDAPVTVSIPYTPAAEELKNPENIIIWYIDGNGNAVSIPDGHYDQAAGTVTFTTTHFSYYAVGYNRVSFNDVAAGSWYNKAVNFISARGITTGTGKENFSPDAKLTRGDFLVMLMKSCNAAPDTKMSENFTDAGNTYYTGYLAAAKRLGISSGMGNNLFIPEKEITRQEMFTMLYNALKVIGKLPQGNSGKVLSDFTDAGQVDSWAKEAMSLLAETGTIGGNAGMLTPTSTTTRAEMAQVLYNLSVK